MSASSDKLSVEVLGREDRAAARDAWLGLERKIGEVGLTCSWDWTEVWLDHYGDLVEHQFAVVRDAGVPCAIVLLTHGVGRRRAHVPVKTLHLGTAGEPSPSGVEPECNRVLVEPGMRRAVAGAVISVVYEDKRWDELHLEGFAPEDAEPFLAAAPGLKARFEPCPTVDLRAADQTNGNVLSTLTSNTRYQIRRSIRAFGEVEAEWAETIDEARDILDELMRLHQARWRAVGIPGAFASERFVEFHRSLLERLIPKGTILLYRVRSPVGTIGCLYSFIDRGNVLSYQLGLARFEDNKMKPGFVAHGLCMQASYDRGFGEYNFLADASPWKRELATTERQLIWAMATRRHPNVVLADTLRATKRLVDRGRRRIGSS